ncbi:MAG: hypothetical protein H0W31_10480, partial [Actinobacteria bacterium]|nr:hypothetical protein [Actinomycetota bacterium]
MSYIVTVTPSGGFTGLVALSVAGLPTDGSGSFRTDLALSHVVDIELVDARRDDERDHAAGQL